jgi:hypothetical protein
MRKQKFRYRQTDRAEAAPVMQQLADCIHSKAFRVILSAIIAFMDPNHLVSNSSLQDLLNKTFPVIVRILPTGHSTCIIVICLTAYYYGWLHASIVLFLIMHAPNLMQANKGIGQNGKLILKHETLFPRELRTARTELLVGQ